jgi:glucan phosphorylase
MLNEIFKKLQICVISVSKAYFFKNNYNLKCCLKINVSDVIVCIIMTLKQGTFLKKIFATFLALLLALNPVFAWSAGADNAISLPPLGTIVRPSATFDPTLIRGLVIHPDTPLKFDFIVVPGNDAPSGDALKEESQRMVNYFLAALAIPEQDLWVNLSPAEKDRIIPDTLGKTELGRDLLAEDYVLKQLTASLIYPEDGLGKAFWEKIYNEAWQKFGTTEVPVDTFNKVWIVPDRAQVFEKGNTVYIARAHLKVMLEADYLASQGGRENAEETPAANITKDLLREIIVPAIEREVNEGKNFARLRQMVYALILAQWYQDVLKDGVLNRAYAGKNKVAGIDLSDPKMKELIYQQYLAAYRKGVFNYIKEETDRLTNETMPKKYFSGGFMEQKVVREPADETLLPAAGRDHAQLVSVTVDRAEATEGARPQAFYNGHMQQVANRELRNYLDHLQNPGTNMVATDVSLEAFLSALEPEAQFPLGKGGLGFLTGETWENYSDLEHWKALGAMPLYSFDKNDNEIDWDNQKGIQPVFVQDELGRRSAFSIDVEFKGKLERAYIYWINANGTPVFLIKHKTLFRKLYPDGEEQIRQYAFLGRAYVELMKALSISPRILRLSEPQLIFVLTSVLNDIEYAHNKGEKSIFDSLSFSMTTHTPERAALPSWENVSWLKSVVGDDLVREDIIYAEKVNAAGAMAYLVTKNGGFINGVSPEHRDVTRVAVLPGFADNTTAVQNGSDPFLWRSEALNNLILEKGIANITGAELFEIGMYQKRLLNEYLSDPRHGFGKFDDFKRPLFAAVRRLVEYKSQAILIPMVKWITGDPDKEYDTPLGRKKGLGANILLGGEALDNITPEWLNEFKDLEQDPQVKGKFVIAERTTGTQFMQLATSAADGWLVMPWVTREASGTSDQRAGFNGHLVIATATGGPLEWVEHGVSGWLVTPFELEHLKRNKEQARKFRQIVRAFQNKEVWALTRFYEEGRRQFATYMTELVDMYREPGRERLFKAMQASFQAAHRRVSIHRMIQEYGIMFDSIIDRVGINEFEKRLATFGSKWETEKLWQKEVPTLEFDSPTSGHRVSFSIVLDGYDSMKVSLSKTAETSGLELTTPNGTFPVKDRSDIYILRSHEQFIFQATPPTPAERLGLTWLRLRTLNDTRMKIDIVRPGVSPVKIIETKDSAQFDTPGGIDATNIGIDRQGELLSGALSDQALEEMLASAPGLRGVIVGITPVPDLPAMLGMN